MTTTIEVPSNATLIEWPTDQYQLTRDVKSASVKAAGRINGSRDKLLVLVNVHLMAIEHAKAKYLADLSSNKQEIARQTKLVVDAKEARVDTAKRNVAAKRAELAHAEAVADKEDAA